MTREEVIKRLNHVYDCTTDAMDGAAIDMAIKALQKENEPAPSANDTSSEENYYNKNDSTEKKKCQEEIAEAIVNI